MYSPFIGVEKSPKRACRTVVAESDGVRGFHAVRRALERGSMLLSELVRIDKVAPSG
jgi:hypothetical protein